MTEVTGTVVWDLETSGLYRDEHEILSISAACGNERFNTLCKPTQPIPAEASRINGLYDAHFQEAPTYEEAAIAFMQWMRRVAGPRPLMVAFNGNRFDVPFLVTKNATIDPARLPAFDAVYTSDPMLIAQEIYTREQVAGSYRQSSVYKMLFGAEPTGQHTSEGDVEALRRIVEHESMVQLVSASAKQLYDLSGQHLRRAVTTAHRRSGSVSV
jgi:DNA polymerase III alpha subunit (gram-positive type)